MTETTLPSGRPFLKGFGVGLFLSFLCVAGLCVGAGLYVNRAASGWADRFLRRAMFDKPDSSLGTVRVDVWRGRVTLSDVRWVSGRWTLALPEAVVEIRLRDLLEGRVIVRLIRLESPLAEGKISFRGGVGLPGQGTRRVPGWVARVPIQRVSVKGGEIRIVNEESNGVLVSKQVAFDVEHDLDVGSSSWRVQFQGKNGSATFGECGGSFTLDPSEPALTFDGEAALRDWPIDPLFRFITPTRALEVSSGRLSLKSQFSCKNDWLTSSHMVTVADFKAEVAPGRKDVFGFPADKVKSLLAIPSLSFVVPMTGAIDDPHIGVASSVQQVLYKVLEGKAKDKKTLEKWARRGGDYIGAKIDAALKSRLRK